MIVNVTDTFRVNIDTYGNYQPEFFKESSVIEKGKYAGQVSEAKWVGAGKYYRNVAQAIWWGIEAGLLAEDDQCDDLTLGQYISQMTSQIDRLESLLNTTQVK